MPRTLEDLARRALSILNEIGAGQAGAPEDLDVARREIPGVLGQLYEMEITAFEVSEPIPEVMFTPIAQFVALAIAPDFGVQSDKLSELGTLAQIGERTLRLLKRGRPTYRPQCSEYF